MKKQILFGAAAAVVVAVPAVIGLWGNASFAQSVPVRVPSSGQIATSSPVPTPTPTPSVSVDDRGGEVPRDQRTEPGDDRDVQGGVSQTPVVPAPAPSADDRGGDLPRDQRTEPGDDRRSGGDDSGSGGSGSSGPGNGGDDSGGRGGDDSGGHGGDD